MNHNNDKHIAAQLIAQLVKELVAYEAQLAASEHHATR